MARSPQSAQSAGIAFVLLQPCFSKFRVASQRDIVPFLVPPSFSRLPAHPCPRLPLALCLLLWPLCSGVPVWLLVGLGARGLVYHAWLGQLVAQAVLSNSERGLPPELLSWRQHLQQGAHQQQA